MIKAIIIDDEQISLRSLGEKIRTHCPDLQVLELFSRAEEAASKIKELAPDVVFLDIEMPKMNGFTLLEKLKPIQFEVIFTTAYSEYAIRALRESAVDFLTKPIENKELIAAVGRLKNRLQTKSAPGKIIEQQLQQLLEYRHPAAQLGQIAIPVLNGLEMIKTADIIKIKGENVYSVFYLAGGKKVTASLTLKEVDSLLGNSEFFRVHKSFIVNLKCIVRYIKGEGGTVLLTDGSEVEVSRRNKADFLKRISATS